MRTGQIAARQITEPFDFITIPLILHKVTVQMSVVVQKAVTIKLAVMRFQSFCVPGKSV